MGSKVYSWAGAMRHGVPGLEGMGRRERDNDKKRGNACHAAGWPRPNITRSGLLSVAVFSMGVTWFEASIISAAFRTICANFALAKSDA
jgi:hypothetical protein